MSVQLHHGDCLEFMRTLPAGSVDAVVTDPPYGLRFMGKHWDYDVPSVEIWRECLRVLKPGGHLLSFAGTRTQHRMAVRIEDAGFEIRDMIAWVYGSGFPKSLDVSKAIDKAAGAEREVVGPNKWAERGGFVQANTYGTPSRPDETAPATDAAREWQGWGTALKPALETVTFALKPFTHQQERDIIASNLFRLEVRIWLLSLANAAEKSSWLSQQGLDEVLDIAQWSAEKVTNTRDALLGQMDMSQFVLAVNTSLNTVSSWRHTLEESWNDGSMFTTVTKLNTTIDLKTLRFSLSQITPENIIKACSHPNGLNASVCTAVRHFNASLSLLQNIRTLSVTAPVISLEAETSLAEGVKPSLSPIVMARKPLTGTVAQNVTQWETGAINVDACRVNWQSEDLDSKTNRSITPNAGLSRSNYAPEDGFLEDFATKRKPFIERMSPAGRWPANLIHDGSDEVVGLFPQTQPSKAAQRGELADIRGNKYNDAAAFIAGSNSVRGHDDNGGSAARFFYCAKASKRDRDEGLEGMEKLDRAHIASKDGGGGGWAKDADKNPNLPRANHHPTVKPTELMRYLCRLVTPPAGIVFDPFAGSGSTGRGAVLEGFSFIGCEIDAGYFEIARKRIEAAQMQPALIGGAS